jgi:hypothetical protein
VSNVIKETFNVSFKHPIWTPSVPPEFNDYPSLILGTALGAEAIGTIIRPTFSYRVQS